jgi:hypothetical protein
MHMASFRNEVNPTKDQAPKNPKKKYGEAEYFLADDKEKGAGSTLIQLIKVTKLNS